MLASGFCAAFANASVSSCANEAPATPNIQTTAIVRMTELDLMFCSFTLADRPVLFAGINVIT